MARNISRSAPSSWDFELELGCIAELVESVFVEEEGAKRAVCAGGGGVFGIGGDELSWWWCCCGWWCFCDECFIGEDDEVIMEGFFTLNCVLDKRDFSVRVMRASSALCRIVCAISSVDFISSA